MNDKKKTQAKDRLKEIDAAMLLPDFWNNKDEAQAMLREREDLQAEIEGLGKYDCGNATLSIVSGAGGDDAEDFARILFEMYEKFASNRGWQWNLIHKHENNHGGYKNISVEIVGKSAYGTLKNESGVHRLVRKSPFNSKGQRHTSFALVEILPELPKGSEIDIDEREVDFSFARSGGPGGQNVNKRDTAVRAVHRPTGFSVHVTSERSQAQNKEKALEMLRAKLYHKQQEDEKRIEQGLGVSSTVDIEWGNQIRSYVFHPYQMVKDHRSGVEVRDVDKVLGGDLSAFME